MTFEPIRPVGLRDGGDSIDRIGGIDRVVRRRTRGRDEGGQGAGHETGHDHEQSEDRPATPIRDPRAYDDHGRTHEDEDGPEHPHVDATA